MKNNSVQDDPAGSSSTCKSLDHFVSITSLQQFQDSGKSVGSVPMDYEFILNNQTEQDRDSETILTSRSNWNEIHGDEVGYDGILYEDLLCSIGCEKDVDCDMAIKEHDSSGIDKGDSVDMKLTHKEEGNSTDKESEIPVSQKELFNSADIEAHEGYEMLTKHSEECARTMKYRNVDVTGGNNRMFNIDADKIGSVDSEYDECETTIRLNEQSSNSDIKDEEFDNDFFDIRASDSEEEFNSGITHKSLCENSDTFPSKKRCNFKRPLKTDLSLLKYETDISSEVEVKRSDNNLNAQANGHFINEENDNMKSNTTDHGILNYKIYEQDVQVDCASDQDLDILTTVSKPYQKQVPSKGKHKTNSSTLLSKTQDTRGLSSQDFDSIDGLYPVHTGRDLRENAVRGRCNSCFQSVSNDALSPFTLISSSRNVSLSNSFISPSCGSLDNAMCTSNDPLIFDNDPNHTKPSIVDSKTDSGLFVDADNIVQGYSEYPFNTQPINSSGRPGQRQRSGACSDIDHFHQHISNSSSVSADTANLATTSLQLLSHKRSPASGSQHLSDVFRDKPDMNYITKTPPADHSSIQTIETLPQDSIVLTSCSSQYDVVYGQSESNLDLTFSTKGLDDPLKSQGNVAAENLQTQYPSSIVGEKQQNTLSRIIDCKVTDISDSIPIAESPYCAGKIETESTGNVSANQISSAMKSSTLQTLFQVPASTSSPTVNSSKTCTNERHVKSIYNTYVNHRLKTHLYSNEEIDNVADKFATVLKSSRKRSYKANHLSTPHTSKKPYLVESSFTASPKGPVTESQMEMDAVGGSFAGSPLQTKNVVQECDGAILQCKICDTSSSGSKTIKCRNSHAICQNCLEDEIRLLMASEKMYMSCPEKSCKAVIPLDSLSSVLPSLIVDFLSDNLRLKEQKASAKAIKKMQGLVICPRCSCPGLLEESQLHYVCTTCNSSCCRYCKAAWTRCEEHDGCFLLSFVGTDCLKDISKLPQNWNTSITPFNKNFVQVNIPLNSSEGSTVAAYFAKTSSGKSNVVQIFRIQNWKLWEKYVLKRKHVEEEIGAADMKEKFLFHGTKAENIVNICGEGFDMRVPTSNGAVLGKGIYFSITARYSERYADVSRMMFLARVICGWSQHGERQMTRPKYHGTSRRMYDSCVDNVSSPTMYTVFDNSQCYPEYLIQFAK